MFVENGRFSGIIDWGDATVTNRHYELTKLHLDTFDCDKSLLRTFLEASNWPIRSDFAQQALKFAFLRQAQCLTQHLSCDAFFKLPDLFPLVNINTLNELADLLFAV